MHLHFEKTVNVKSDCAVLSLSWMGRVPDEMPEGDEWKLNRVNYYQEGWLATGNTRGNVGITYTTSSCKRNIDIPLRANYNLRGHRPEVILVKWNEPYQKLASCDSSGIIFVWIKYEGRWSIELINDRNTAVTYFSWSHDGRMALICYQDGFVLVGSVAGQRYWSSLLNVNATTTCGIWTPDDQQVYLSTNTGQIIVMDVHGAMVSQVQLQSGVGIVSMAWSCGKFKMEEEDEQEQDHLLAVCFRNGIIYLVKTFDDISPIQVDTCMSGTLCMEWSNSKELLAVAGNDKCSLLTTGDYNNLLKFYNKKGSLVFSTKIPFTQAPVTALTWGHNDKRIFVATGAYIHIAWVSNNLASLQLLCGLLIRNSIYDEKYLPSLQLPRRICHLIENLYAETIRCCVPKPYALRQFVSRPPTESTRLHCTMIKHGDDNLSSPGSYYTLYLEYLGGLLPILKGKRISKIKPEFVIFDPQMDDSSNKFEQSLGCQERSEQVDAFSQSDSRESDSSYTESGDSSPNSPRKRRKNRKKSRRHQRSNVPTNSNQSYNSSDSLPKNSRLVEVTSNIWGTKFRIQGFVNNTSVNLGHIAYKTSLLHLQPRQMTLVITELEDDCPVVHSQHQESAGAQVMSDEDDDFDECCARDSTEVDLSFAQAKPNLRISVRSPYVNLAMESNLKYLKLLKKHVKEDVTGENKWCKSPNLGNRTRNVEKPQHNIPSCTVETGLQSPKNAIAPCDVFEVLPSYSSFYHPAKTTPGSSKDVQTPQTSSEAPNSPILTRTAPHYLGTLSCDEDGPSTARSNIPNESIIRSCSVGYLDLAERQIVPSDSALIMLQKDIPKPLVLSKGSRSKGRASRQLLHCTEINVEKSVRNLKKSGKSRSLDSSDVFRHIPPIRTPQFTKNKKTEDAIEKVEMEETETEVDSDNNRRPSYKSSINTQLLSTFENLKAKLRVSEWSKSVTKRLPRSSPSTPVVARKDKRPQSASPVRKRLFMSPSTVRRSKQKPLESSEDEGGDDGPYIGENYRNLEAFQKALLRQKLRKGKCDLNSSTEQCNGNGFNGRKIVMHNKEPIWNENSQVYQLDFGGRVTQESAKNFQIEYRGKQVMQFGRIDSDVYTLDFQYPFTSLQAFAVALANVTQRLK